MIIEIGDILVSSEILTECFSCDLSICHGSCCVVGDSGAPLTEKESLRLKKNFVAYAFRLTKEGLKAIENQGFSVVDSDGDLVTPLVAEAGRCAYAIGSLEGLVSCAVQKFKPLSCALYPIRVKTLSNGLKALNLSREHLCRCAFKKGEKEKLPAYKFLREVLIKAFGLEFYEKLDRAALLLRASI